MSIIETALDKARRAATVPTITPDAAAASLQLQPEVNEPAAFAQRRIAIDLNLLRAQGELPEAGLERRFADY